MAKKIKGFFARLWRNIEDAQMARARYLLQNNSWSRIE